MRRADVDLLDSNRIYWVASVEAPHPDWRAAPGCCQGARFLIDRHSLKPTRDGFAAFASKLACLRWIMRQRSDLTRALPEARVNVVRLDRFLLGLD